MSQHDFNIANQSFPATRTDINDAILAIVSNSSGDTEPSTTYANQWWYETDTNILKIRNEANNGWVDVITLDASMTASASELNQLDAITRGSIIYGNASGATARLAKGGAGTVLSSDGTDISWTTPAGGGATELIATLTANNSTTLNFTGFDASTYGSYLFKVDLKPATANVTLRALVSTDGGSNYLSGSTDYFTDGTTRAYMELSGGGGSTAAENLRNGDIVLISPDNTSNYSIFASYVSSGGDAYPGLNNHNRNSVFKSTTAVNAVRFYLALGPQSGGNFTSGTIRVYGFKK